MTGDIQKNILVTLIDVETEETVRQYWTSDLSETLKMFYAAKECGVELQVCVPEDREEDKYSGTICGIEDVDIRFGDKDNLTLIRVYGSYFV